jgi:enoyl-CoA hydratase/carnithine racemase
VRNAIDESVVRGLELALAGAEADLSVRCVVLTGEGDKAFISGADLNSLRDAASEERTLLDERMNKLLQGLEALPVPIIAALNGVAIGGGAEVALACDLRIAEPHASMTFKHAAMGVTPGWGGLTRLLRVVNRASAARLLFTAEAISSHEALLIGLADEIVAAQASRPRALELGEAVAQNSPEAVAAIKRLLRSSAGKTRAEAEHEERAVFLERARSDDHREALTAHFEKRAPRFAARLPTS